jgi:hypothetical protein
LIEGQRLRIASSEVTSQSIAGVEAVLRSFAGRELLAALFGAATA